MAVKGDSRQTGAPGRRVLVLAAWRSEDTALRALVTSLRELVPCSFDILNLDSPTSARYSVDPQALYARIRRYDAAVCAFAARDGAASPTLQLPGAPLPVSRFLVRRTPAFYLTDGLPGPEAEAAVEAHARSWRMLDLGIASAAEPDSLTRLAASLRNSLGMPR